MSDISKPLFSSPADITRSKRLSLFTVIGVWGLIILVIGILVMVSLTPRADADRRSILLPALVVVAITVLGSTWGRSWRRGVDLLEPPVYLTVWCLGFYIFPTVMWALGLGAISLNPIIADDPGRWLAISSWATAAGLAAMWGGYLVVTKRRQLAFGPPPASSPELRVGLAEALYAISVVVRFLLFTYGARGNAGVFRDYYAGGSASAAIDQFVDVAVKCLTAAGPALFLCLLSRPRLRRADQGWMLLILLGEVVLGTLSGSRGGVVFTLIYFAAYYRYARGQYPSWKLIPLAILLLALSVPVINQLRSETVDVARMNPMNFLQSLQTASGQVVSMSAGNIWDEVQAVAFDRQMSVFQMQAAMLRLHPNIIPFAGADQLVLFPLYLIPRALWPDKPATFDALETSKIYAGIDSLTFSSPILVGDLYIQAGWPLLVLGMFVFGVIQGVAYKYLVGSAKIINLVFYTMIFFQLSHWEGQLSGVLSILLRSVPLFWLFLNFILFRRSQRTTRLQAVAVRNPR